MAGTAKNVVRSGDCPSASKIPSTPQCDTNSLMPFDKLFMVCDHLIVVRLVHPFKLKSCHVEKAELGKCLATPLRPNDLCPEPTLLVVGRRTANCGEVFPGAGYCIKKSSQKPLSRGFTNYCVYLWQNTTSVPEWIEKRIASSKEISTPLPRGFLKITSGAATCGGVYIVFDGYSTKATRVNEDVDPWCISPARVRAIVRPEDTSLSFDDSR
ncbi:hypothetical protein BDV96DRAFT_602275 [Lophiotrema nucula]|uniref:Uncharacterized protein n=1 Tax=Lophiotrema nucula TaxID=690887 RepID=A0A6A5Z1R7_9PLEO|nr:hypothetical protein BDV96DRAFT_602275 [Lophiotrema nucula]